MVNSFYVKYKELIFSQNDQKSWYSVSKAMSSESGWAHWLSYVEELRAK